MIPHQEYRIVQQDNETWTTIRYEKIPAVEMWHVSSQNSSKCWRMFPSQPSQLLQKLTKKKRKKQKEPRRFGEYPVRA